MYYYIWQSQLKVVLIFEGFLYDCKNVVISWYVQLSYLVFFFFLRFLMKNRFDLLWIARICPKWYLFDNRFDLYVFFLFPQKKFSLLCSRGTNGPNFSFYSKSNCNVFFFSKFFMKFFPTLFQTVIPSYDLQ